MMSRQLDMKNMMQILQDVEIIKKVLFHKRHILLGPIIMLENEKRAMQACCQGQPHEEEYSQYSREEASMTSSPLRMIDHQMKVDVHQKDTPADPLNGNQVPLIVDGLRKIDAHETHSPGHEFNFANPKDCIPLDSLPDEETPFSVFPVRVNHGLEKSDLKKTASIYKISENKVPIQAETQIPKPKPLESKGQTSVNDPVRELREMVQGLKSDLDHERTMRVALDKRVLELEQQKCGPDSQLVVRDPKMT
jgi:hypothetical protein